MDKKVKTLSDQMEEYSQRKEKIEQLRKELIVNPAWDIIEDDGEFYAKNCNGELYRINVEMREKFPQTLFKTCEFDDCFLGIDPITKVAYYDCLAVGATHIRFVENSTADFGDAIEDLLAEMYDDSEMKDKNLPLLIYPVEQIESHWKDFVECMEYFSAGEFKFDLIKNETVIKQLKENLTYCDGWDIIEEDGVYYVHDSCYGEYYRINVKMREKFPQAVFKEPEFDDCIVGIDPFTKVVYYDCLALGSRYYHIHCGIAKFKNCIQGLLEQLDIMAQMKGENLPVLIFMAKHIKEYWNRFVETMEGFSDGKFRL